MINTLFIFPGQGSQYRGIGSDLYHSNAAAREIYSQANELLDFDIQRLSFEDPDDEITLTRNTQPVLLTHSMACLAALRDAMPDLKPSLVGGHSLGEYGALTCAGVLNFSEGLKLVRRRGELMGDLGKGEMLAVPLPRETLEPLAIPHHCAVAGINLKDQTVVGGLGDDLDRLTETLAESYPRKRATRLKTEGAFHTYYMVAAALEFRGDLAATDFKPAQCDVLSNFSGGTHNDNATATKSHLFWQLFNPVLWHANLMTALESGVERVVEFGGGIGKTEGPAEKRANLEGIVKKAYRSEQTKPAYYSVINEKTLEDTLTALST